MYPFIQLNFFSSSSDDGTSKHPWGLVDRLDPYLDSISPMDLRGFKPIDPNDSQKVKSKIYGIHKYCFSEKLTLSFDARELDSKKEIIRTAAAEFLNSLKDGAVYKCLFVGVTAMGEIKTSSEGGFYVSKHTRPDYIYWKIKNGVAQFEFKYKGISFDSYSMAYKEWLLSKDIGDKWRDLVKVLESESLKDQARYDHGKLQRDVDSVAPPVNIEFFNRWLKDVGSIDSYTFVDSSKYVINIRKHAGGGYNVEVEPVESGDSVS